MIQNCSKSRPGRVYAMVGFSSWASPTRPYTRYPAQSFIVNLAIPKNMKYFFHL